MENNKYSFNFMAFSKGNESVNESANFKRYIGVAPVSILAVNPTKAELEKVYNRTIENEPNYISEIEVGADKHKVLNARIDFIVKTDSYSPECKGVELISKLSFFIRKEYRTNRDNTKVQVIDKYGRTAWVTKEQYKNKEIPMYSNGPANLDKDYRACFVGEEDLTNFVKTYLCIPNVMKYVNNTWVMVDNPEDCEARLESVEKYFNNDFKEIKDIIQLQPNNRVKVLFGVRTTNDNKQYQTIYNQMFLRASATDFSRLEKDVTERKNAGAYSTTEFEAVPLKEYEVKATDFSTTTPTTDPFFNTSNNNSDLSFTSTEEDELPW